MASPYTSKSEVVSYLNKLKGVGETQLVEADIPDSAFNGAGEIIDKKTRSRFSVFAGDLYVDGDGQNYVICPRTPIITLTALVIIKTDLTTEALVLTTASRNVWYHEATGLIKRIAVEVDRIEYGQEQVDSIFPTGVKNIKMTGTFGGTSANTLALIQILETTRILGFFMDFIKKTNLIEEKIGEYSYKLGDMQTGKDPNNARKTLDGYIEYLYSCLPKDDDDALLGV
jgi:hypothetical protein